VPINRLVKELRKLNRTIGCLIPVCMIDEYNTTKYGLTGSRQL
jgi:hypothetical protein